MRNSVPLAARFFRFFFGPPIATKHSSHQKLPKYLALGIFSSDALSSVAYATEEIMLVLTRSPGVLYAGLVAWTFTFHISVAICLLVAIVITSYYQTIQAYPDGGGSYIVAKDNLGIFPGWMAASALLIDYVLTVAVSVTAGILALISMLPALQNDVVLLGVLAVIFITVANLRGMRESGMVFALPVYSFIFLILGVGIAGLFKEASPIPEQYIKASEANLSILPLFVLLRAFASGCTALTGVEAVSDGIPAFRTPSAKNASITLTMMGVLLIAMLLGISYSAEKFHVLPMYLSHEGYRTIVAQIVVKIFGEGTYFYLLQIMTAGILILAANTSFVDFPRLASFLSKDGYLPRSLANIGDRLVFQNGVIVLSAIAIGLIIWFKGNTAHLIPLYAVGVFLAFTLSQLGMVVHSWRHGRKIVSMTISLIGAIVTSVITVLEISTKFSEGAWMVPIAMTVMILIFAGIHRHYKMLSEKLNLALDEKVSLKSNTVLLLVPRLHRGIIEALSYARSTTKDCRALHVTLDTSSTKEIKDEWKRHGGEDIPLVILESPYRSLVEPILEYIDQILQENPAMMVTVIVPQAILKYRWQDILHNNFADQFKKELAARPNVVVTNVRYFVK